MTTMEQGDLGPGFSSLFPDEPDVAPSVVEAAQAQAAADGPRRIEIPDLAPPPELEVMLPGGLRSAGDAAVRRRVVVRELTGEDEEAIAKAAASNNYGKLITAYIDRGVESLEGEPIIDSSVLKRLFIGDRDFLILAIRRATYGDTLKFDYRCDCGQEWDVTYDLSKDVPIRELPTSPWPLTVPLRRGHQVRFLPLTGIDQEVIHESATTWKKSAQELIVEQNTLAIQRAVLDINGVPPTWEGVRGLGTADRQILLKAIGESQPGPRYNEATFKCSNCETEVPVPLGLDDLFRLS